MKLKAYSIYELGKRTNQEDNIYPLHGEATDADRLFMVCDGMGGHDSGEVASATVCEAMSKGIEASGAADGTFSDDDFRTLLAAAYDALDAKDNGAEKKMGTTMTFLKFHAEGATLAHIGDSRIYHVRPAEKRILFQTRDHSLVNDLIKAEELTPEEAKNFSQKNVITRAMQPLQERRSRADIHHIPMSDIRSGDYFFLCSDGMLEEMEDENLLFMLSKEGTTDEEKIKMLIGSTEENKDNHSAYLIHIIEGEDGGATSPTTLQTSRNRTSQPAEGKRTAGQTPSETGTIRQSKGIRRLKYTSLFVALFLILVALFYFLIKGGLFLKENLQQNDEPAAVEHSTQQQR